jgi:hypothetical protein
MGTATWVSIPHNTNSPTSFRDWGQPFSQALATVGLVQTADTGQIDWSTVANPSSSSTLVGYEIWRFNDSLQATAPVFLRVEYRSSTTTVNPRMDILIGTASDGAGNVTQFLPTLQLNATTAGLTNQPCYMSSGDGHGLVFALWTGSTSGYRLCGFMERTRDAAGNATGAGFYHISQNNGTFSAQYFLNTYASPNPFNSPVVAGRKWSGGVMFGGALGLAWDGTVPAFPNMFTDARGNYWYSKLMLAGAPADYTDGVTFQIDGVTHIAMNTIGGADGANSANAIAIFRWT